VLIKNSFARTPLLVEIESPDPDHRPHWESYARFIGLRAGGASGSVTMNNSDGRTPSSSSRSKMNTQTSFVGSQRRCDYVVCQPEEEVSVPLDACRSGVLRVAPLVEHGGCLARLEEIVMQCASEEAEHIAMAEAEAQEMMRRHLQGSSENTG
ncbi:unnamed protein product, partial [Amoebophrya sp. A25]